MSVALSAIVLTRNRRARLLRCLTSLFAQTYPKERMEIIVIDDGSSDGTGRAVDELLRDHEQVRYLFQEHQGVAAARNAGLKLAKGGVVAFLADDYLLPADYARTVMSFFEENPAAEVIRSRTVTDGSGFVGRVIQFYDGTNFRSQLLRQGEETTKDGLSLLRTFYKRLPSVPDKLTTGHRLAASGAAAFRVGVFSKVGVFDERLVRGEDTELADRLHRTAIPVHYDPRLIVRHVWEDSLGRFLAARFAAGVGRYGYVRHRAFSRTGTNGERAAPEARLCDPLSAMTKAVYNIGFRPLWRVRQAEPLTCGVLYYPFVLMFDTAYEIGFLWAAVRDRKNGRNVGREIGR
jgi:GT2 family glycosyltransferase